ncbi:flagellar basal-body MS-ring/collar protein FliF [Alloyangia pacifica]|uniref:Flagellar M-ring protein n=1 Tax=Alloyangia pacifica TaxID=311180 RepID=A0A1I6SZA7_9RHOB|nr:flagellar basal-body MS-ring/collar protein FliF [Alloyangia pacifica]SDG92424.1 flagellar M-ring protein FliF [Alloyangia pacifica]SFS82345.1 flagellar M-ring protein FliF [Alloyangia pacifica]
MQAILENLKSLGWRRLSVLGGTGLALVLAVFFGLSVITTPDYVSLYRDLNPADAARIVDSLEAAGIRSRTDTAGTAVSVPAEDMARARMELASLGLPNEGTPGWELFDEQSGLGMNSFMQRVNRMRAMEGELARSIQTIDGVEAARVHLVMPEREPFSRERPTPSASVIVRGSRQIGMKQAHAIRSLVASAVPDLAPAQVTVLSASGETILADDGEAGSEASLQSARAQIEDRLSQRITQILSARVGAGNARVTVSVDLTSERQVVREQTYDPDQRVVRSTETREETTQDQRAASGEVGVADDVPAALADAVPGTNSNSSNTNNEIVNYEIGGKQVETVREPGDVERMSVAVLINGIYNVQPDGSVEYEERGPDELERLQALVQSAMGFDEARGDSIEVVSLRFMDYSMDVGEPVARSFTQVLSENIGTILRGLFALGLVAAVLAFAVRPALSKLMAANGEVEGPKAGGLPAPDAAPALPGAKAPPGLPGQSNVTQLHAGQQGGAGAEQVFHSGTVLDPIPEGGEEMVSFASVQGGVQRGWINTVGELIEREPDDAIKVVKSWLAEGSAT